MKAVLRNTSYTKSIFYKLKFNMLKEPENTLEEGYDFQKTTLSIPIPTQGPHNVYSSIDSGERLTLKDVNFASYDPILHQQYKQFYKFEVYNHVDVFKTWGSQVEVSHVDFNECYIQHTRMKVDFFKVTFTDTTIENVLFKNGEFNGCRFTHTSFINCQFKNCTFNNCTFDCVVFKDCDMDKTFIKNCHLSGRFINCYLLVSFDYTEMYLNLFDDCFGMCKQWGCYYPYKETRSIGTSFVHMIKEKEFITMLNQATGCGIKSCVKVITDEEFTIMLNKVIGISWVKVIMDEKFTTRCNRE